MSAPPGVPGDRSNAPTAGYYFVLDAEDRITHVSTEPEQGPNPFVGRVIWERLPGAEPLLREYFEQARRTGSALEFTVFYAAETKRIRVYPAADGIAVHVEPVTTLDVRSLATLARSLRQIEAELAAREPARLDPRAPSSLRSLP